MRGRPAKHTTSSRSGPAASVAPAAKLSPATNTSTGRADVLLEWLVATSRTFWSLPPYFRFRVSDTPAQDCDWSGAATAGVASAGVAPSGAVAFGAAAAGAASAGAGSEPSVTSPAFIKFAAMPGHSRAGTEVPVIAVSKKQRTRYFVMTGHTGT